MDATAVTPLIRHLPPHQTFLIPNKTARYSAAAASAGATLALLILRTYYTDWNQDPPAHVLSTLGIGMLSQTTFEILAPDDLSSRIREFEARFGFPLSLIIAQLERNPIGSVDEKIWKIAFSDVYNVIVGLSVAVRITTIVRKRLADEPISSPADHPKKLLCENSLLGTQTAKVAIAASLITISQLFPDITPYAGHFGFLLAGHTAGLLGLGKGFDKLENCLAKRSIPDEFADDLIRQWDAVTIFRTVRHCLREVSGAAIGGLFVVLSSQSSLLQVEIINVAIGAILGAQKWDTKKNMPATMRILAQDRNTTVLKTQQVWALAAFGLTMLGWLAYMVEATDEDDKTIEVLTPFVGCSFLSFFATLFLHKKADENSSSFLTSLQFYFIMFRILPLLFLYFTEEFDLDLDKQSVEASESTAFDFDVLGWTFLGLALGNHLAQRRQALNLSDFIFAIFANSVIYELKN